jgi:hypothetical protein
MSAAPPPPPPPPPRKPSSSDASRDNLFDLLPAELLLMIIKYAGIGNLMNLALAIYPTLQHHRLAPELTAHTYLSIVRVARTSNTITRRLPLPRGLIRMPMELWYQVAREVEPIDILSMMLAVGMYPRELLTPETARRIRIWSCIRRSKRKDAL